MVTSTITLLNTMRTKHQIDWDSATCITYSTDYYQRLTIESWFTNLEQTPLNRSQQLPAPYKRLIDEIKKNYLRENDWRTDNLTNNKRLFNCDNRHIETHQLLITSLHSQYHHGLTDRRPINIAT